MSQRVLAIYIAPVAGGAVVEVPEVRAVLGHGLEGDRYAAGAGTYSRTPGSGRHVTLIEAEALEAAARDYQIELAPGAHRRNLVVAGVALNHLVGRELTVGGVRLLGTRLCEPCKHLEELTVEGARKALVHRGGLRCDIVAGGVIRPGDPVTV